MNDLHENTVLAFCEWLDKAGYAYALFIGGGGGSGVVLNDESGELLGTIASGLVDHPGLAEFMATALSVAANKLENDKEMN